eukprot:Colp12_sorted_trinity150504_noHs@7992
MVALPYVLYVCGSLFGLLLLANSAILTIFSLEILIKAVRLANQNSYGALANHVFGSNGARAVELVLLLCMIGNLVSLFSITGDVVPSMADAVPALSMSRTTAVLIVAVLVILLSSLEDISKLTIVSKVSIVLYFVFALVLFYTGLTLPADRVVNPTFFNPQGFFKGFPIICFAFCCHPSLYPVLSSCNTQDAPLPTLERIIRAAIFGTLGVYLFIAFSGYYIGLDHTNGNILNNLSSTQPAVFMVKLAFVFTLVCSGPMLVFPARESIQFLMTGKRFKPPTFMARVVPAAGVVIVSLLFALVFTKLESIVGLVGATTAVTLCFILPGLFYVKLSPANDWTVTAAKALIIFGFVAGTICTVTILS